MEICVPPLTKICAKCKLPKNYNDDFGSNKNKPDYKDEYCYICRREQVKKSKAKNGAPKSAAEKRSMVKYVKKLKTERLFGKKEPITDLEIDELIIWLKNPEAWESISAYRTNEVKCALKRSLNQIKYHSLWIAPKTK